MKKYTVLKTFADKNDIAKRYRPGDELPGTFGEERLENIVSCGLAKVEDSEAGNGKGNGMAATDVDLTGNVAAVLSQLKDFADVEKLTQYLETEKSKEKPRKAVIEVIAKQLTALGIPGDSQPVSETPEDPDSGDV